jgi:OmpA-OmpF porin, OOP family
MRQRLASCVALFVVWVLPSAAAAQGFALNILDAADRGSEWFATESLDLRGHGRLSLGLTGDWAYRPLVASRRDGQRPRAIVRNQLFVQPGLSVVLWERLRLALDVPLLLFTDGSATEEGVSVGDVRLGAMIRLFGRHGGVITGAFGVHVALPTGNRDAYLSDGGVRFLPYLALAGDYAGFVYALKLGAATRFEARDVLSTHMGHYAYFALSLGVRMFDRRLVLGPELFGFTVTTEQELWKRRATPLEALLGLHYSFDNGLRLGAGIGFGLTTGLGAPEQRGLLSLEWNTPLPAPPPVAAADRDGDGVIDSRDICPDRPGDNSDNPLQSGCPQPVDTDHDGVRDVDDACPEHAGEDNDDPSFAGCPKPKDRDRDGVIDADDACPDVPGQLSADPQASGCPDAS